MIELIRNELKRLSWPLVATLVTMIIAFGFVGISKTNLEVVLFKFLVFCPALVLVHLSRRTLFPYLDLSKIMEETISQDDNDSEGPSDMGCAIKDAAIIIGIFSYYVGMTYVLTAVI